MRRIFLTLVVFFVFFQIVNIFTHFIIVDRTSYEPVYNIALPFAPIVKPWLNFDGLNYLKIAINGYDLQNIAFFPLYPFIVSVFSLRGLMNPIITGLILSFFFTSLSLCAYYELVKRNYSKNIAYRSVLIMLLFPSSFFLFAYYTESLFLFLTIMFFWFLGKNKLLLSSMFLALASLTRIYGLALFAPLLYVAYKKIVTEKRIPYEISIAPLGIVSYGIYLFIKFGSPFLIIDVQNSDRFSREVGFMSPVFILKSTFLKLISGPSSQYDSPFVYPVIVFEAMAIIFAVIMLAVTYKKIGFPFWVYCLTYVFIMIFSGGLSSDIRYLLMLFPFFIFISEWLPSTAYKAWLLFSGLLLLFSCSLFFRNYWIG